MLLQDVWAYTAVGIPIVRIFTINSKGELKHELTQTFQSRYVFIIQFITYNIRASSVQRSLNVYLILVCSINVGTGAWKYVVIISDSIKFWYVSFNFYSYSGQSLVVNDVFPPIFNKIFSIDIDDDEIDDTDSSSD